MRPSAPVISSQGFSSSSSLSSINANSSQTSIVGAAVISNKPVLYLPEKEPKSLSGSASSLVKAPPIKKFKVEEKASSTVKAPATAPVTVCSCYFYSRY